MASQVERIKWVEVRLGGGGCGGWRGSVVVFGLSPLLVSSST